MSNDTDRLLLDAMNVEAFLHKLAMMNVEAQHRLALYRLRQQADQARAPAGEPRGDTKTQGAAVPAAQHDPKSAAGAEPGK
jgi:hypothetical protein